MNEEQQKALLEAAEALRAMKSSMSEKYGEGLYGTTWWTANRESVENMNYCVRKCYDLGVFQYDKPIPATAA